MTFIGLSGKRYQTEVKAFSSGGEGDIFGISGIRDKVIKVYHSDKINEELEEKLKTMVRRPPNSSILSQVAWPLDTVYDDSGHFCGFVMPRLSITAELSEIYTYPPRTGITYKQKLILAQNICVVISEVHKAGYIFGDFNPRNIGINTNSGKVAFLDTDSYHIIDGTNTYRCKVCLDGYVAPELLKKCEPYKKDAYACAPLPTFTKETDNFALAIHIFKLLMNGFTPFNGIKESERASTSSPGLGNQAIKRDEYCFKPGNKPMSPAVPSVDVLPVEIADLFTRAFMYGKVNPKERPSAIEWYHALDNYEAMLIQCRNNKTHLYKKGLNTCPWCEADERFKVATTPQLKQKGFAEPVQPIIVPNVSYGYAGNKVSSQYGATNSVYTNTVQATSVQGSPIQHASVQLSPQGSQTKIQQTPKSSGLSSQSKKRIAKISFIVVAVVLIGIVGAIIINQHIKKQNLYEEAVKLLEQGNYSSAINAFYQLGNYKNSEELLLEANEYKTEQDYIEAMTFLKSGNYDDAMTAFSLLGNYKDSAERYEEAKRLKCTIVYGVAEDYLQSGNIYEAATTFYSIGDYGDAREKCFACWSQLTERNTVSAGGEHSKGFTLGVKSNGTVITTGNNQYGQCDVEKWSHIIAVAAGMYHSVGLQSDGTVVAVGRNDDGQCDVSSWKDIVAVSAYYHTVGLKADGTVVATGSNEYGECNVSNWKDIIAIAAGPGRTLGLKADGTVLAVGQNEFGSAEVSNWSDIVTICTDMSYSFGLRSDGTLSGVGEVSWHSDWMNWTNIIDVAHGCLDTVGVRNDGTTVATNKSFSGWTNIIMVDGRSYHVIGLRSDGTVIAAGNNESGQCDVEDWSDIMIPTLLASKEMNSDE